MKIISFSKLILFFCLLLLLPAHYTYAHNSLLEFENFILYGYLENPSCVSRGLVITNIATINSTGSYTYDSPMEIKPPNSTNEWYKRLSLRMENHMASAIAGINNNPGFGFASNADRTLMESVCRSAFVFKPHEYYAWQNGGLSCIAQGGVIVNQDSTAPTEADIPFYYHCDPNFNPMSNTMIITAAPGSPSLFATTQGYMGNIGGGTGSFCSGANLNYANKDMVGKIVVGYYPEPALRKAQTVDSNYRPCVQDGRQVAILSLGDQPKFIGDIEVITYINQPANGPVEICAASINTLYPIKIGCTQYSPPARQSVNAPNVWDSTTCQYLKTGRSDLHSLGASLNDLDSEGRYGGSVKKFLNSNIHPLSTAASCVKDVLKWVMVGPPYNPQPDASYFASIQNNLKGVVLSTLILYMALRGIFIMLNYHNLEKGKLIMDVVKIALVYYFALGDAWNTWYPSLLQVSDELTDIFLQTNNINDVANHCTYSYDGSELLQERNVGVPEGGLATLGQNSVIKLTVWDFIDCKLINYINFGSCVYDPVGVVMSWAASILGIFRGGLIFLIISTLYAVFLVKMVMEFFQVAILSIFTITILVFLSPIFFCFFLFEATKGIFTQWAQFLLGYLLYPPILFIFMTLVFMTFDSVYYGNIGTIEFDRANGRPSYTNACKGVDSMFCSTINYFESKKGNLCDAPYGNFGASMVNSLNVILDLKIHIIDSTYMESFFNPMGKMALWALVFYIFSNLFSQFAATMVSVTAFTHYTRDIGAGKGLFAGVGGMIKKITGR